MKIILVAVVGFVIQTIGLGAFIATSNSAWASPGKELMISITVLAMAVLLLFANKPYAIKRAIAISAVLATGYLIAHSILAITLFTGLLKDIPVPSGQYFQTIAEIFGILFALYFLGSAVAGWINRVVSRSRQVRTS